MSLGPIQITLLTLSLTLSLSLVVTLLRKRLLSTVYWYAIIGLFCCLVQDVFGLFVLTSNGGHNWTGLYLAFEIAGATAWFFFGKHYARLTDDKFQAGFGWPAVLAASVLFGCIAASSDFISFPSIATSSDFALTTIGFAIRVTTLAVLITSLTNLEATLVNSVHGQRWRIKFTILGVFSILAAQVFTVSLGLLYKSLEISLISAKQIGFIMGTSFMLYSALFRGGEAPVTISKRLARTSIVLFGAGAYLLFLGALGLVLGLTGYAGNKAFLLALGLVVGVGILTLLLSDSFRRRLNRILQNYFYKEKYDYRVQWLSFTKRLAQKNTRDSLYHAVLLGFCETFGMGGAILYLKDQHSRKLIAVQSLEIALISPPLTIGDVFSDMISAGMPAVDVRVLRNALDTSSQAFFVEIKAAFAVPLMHNDSLDGIILLAKPIDTSEEYNQEDFDLMEALATQAHSAMLNYRLTDQLTKVRDMEVMGKVSTFIVHDLKNLVYTISLIVDNAKRHIQNPDFQCDMLKGLESTVSKMHLLISQLRQLPSRENLNIEPVDLKQLSHDTFKHTPEQGLSFRGESTEALVDRVQIQKVIHNLALNALEASRENSLVIIETGMDNSPFLRVMDSGCGMSAEFIRDNLFQPFKTTKPKGMGIGLYQCKQIVEAHGGSIEVESSTDKGSIFTVRFPPTNAPTISEDA
jgi:putative PEP-CTERM system histidine kinase